MSKLQRIRDPIHDLIEFGTENFEQGLWDVLNSPEFGRLRRIKQLGFSELVYPGATHSRFAHSVGVFHTARQLAEKIKQILGTQYNIERANVALAAALVHDVGHGPFSHAFESALKALDKRSGTVRENRHEIWTAGIVKEDTTLGLTFQNHIGLGPDLRNSVAELLLQETPTDIYSAIVSSQFDADRLDYLRRDRLMTGARHGGFDFSWLLANLDVDQVSYTTDGDTYAHVDTLILKRKAFQAAESYVLGLFHMYFAVYFHKATRSAEKMLTAVILRLGQLMEEGRLESANLSKDHPLVRFLNDRSLSSYLELDDSLVWGSLRFMASSPDASLAHLAHRLLNRQLYKSVDVASELGSDGQDAMIAEARGRFSDAKQAGIFDEFEVFEDRPKRNPYQRRGYDTPEALSRVLIRRSDGTNYEDLAKESDVVGALREKSIYRIYVRDNVARDKVKSVLVGG